MQYITQEEKQRRKVHFNDLDGWLQTIVVISWIMAAANVLAFFVGFIVGILS
jgi:hypothetical protein